MGGRGGARGAGGGGGGGSKKPEAGAGTPTDLKSVTMPNNSWGSRNMEIKKGGTFITKDGSTHTVASIQHFPKTNAMVVTNTKGVRYNTNNIVHGVEPYPTSKVAFIKQLKGQSALSTE